ncbi:hypothetical protein ACVWXO_010613 [Bradyrhizobium sp. LM2.7]
MSILRTNRNCEQQWLPSRALLEEETLEVFARSVRLMIRGAIPADPFQFWRYP